MVKGSLINGGEKPDTKKVDKLRDIIILDSDFKLVKITNWCEYGESGVEVRSDT